MFLEGVASTAVAVVGGALVIAAAMKHTGLDRRVAIAILKRTGTGPRGILAGALLVGIVLSFFVPSTTARGRRGGADHGRHGRRVWSAAQ
jgi:di/tricarboxylate transporter